ncbi:histidine kinase [Solirubrobacter taibaiensis]|nr:histidine kinase [Solirubrobacter taibaiensis]
MVVIKRVRGWLRAHPTGADALLALLVFVVAIGPGLNENSEEIDLTPIAVVLAALGSASLVLRRRHPWWVLGLAAGVGTIGIALNDGPTTVFVPAIFALYSLTVRVETAPALAATLGCALVPALVMLTTTPYGLLDSSTYQFVSTSGLAAVSGIAVRNQRAVVAAAHERARQAEATREEEAQRRVADERVRIARELHDVVAHHVSVINVQASVAGQLLRTDPDGAAAALAHVREASQTVLREVPGLLGLLRTGNEALETAPAPRLADAEVLIDQARRSGLQVVWQTSGTPSTLAPGTDLAAYRVLQEALTNAQRHGAGEVLVRVVYADGALTLEVRNAQAETRAAVAGGQHGLLGMRERVAATGGTLTAGPDEAGTWVVRAELPVRP